MTFVSAFALLLRQGAFAIQFERAVKANEANGLNTVSESEAFARRGT